MGICLNRLGYEYLSANNLRYGLEVVERQDVDAVFLDNHLPDAEGLESINRFKLAKSMPEVIIITGDTNSTLAEQAIKKGAWHYLRKPASLETIKSTLRHALQHRENRLNFFSSRRMKRDNIIGDSPALMHSLLDLGRAAAGGGSVLLTGETGTGKELFARALHDNSSRSDKPFVSLDCTNIPDTLAESILFGHVKGAFTNALGNKEGLIAQANGGTLFLDEIGDLPSPLQGSLLRVLEEKKFRPVGSDFEKQSDFRIVAATNKNVWSMVQSGQFRADLFYRLAQHHLHLPPLRDRVGDVAALSIHFTEKLCQELGLPEKSVSEDFIDTLRDHDWPGNVRELVNVVAGSISNAFDESVLQPHHLPMEQKASLVRKELDAPASENRSHGGNPQGEQTSPPFPSLSMYRDKMYEALEAEYLDKLISACGGDFQQALELAGISRSRLYQLLKKYGRTLGN